MGGEDEAVYRFVKAIEEKLPVVAEVVGDYRGSYGMRGEEVLHFHDIDEQLIAAMTHDEQAWLRSTWRSPAVAAMRERHIANGQAFAAATTRPEREVLSNEVRAMVAAFKPKEMPALSTGTDWLMSGRVAARGSRRVIHTTPETWRCG